MHGGAEAPLIVQQSQALSVALQPPGSVLPPQVGVHGERVDEDPWIEQTSRVEHVLDPTEQLDGVGGVHQRQQLGPRPTIAVLAGERSSVRGREARRVDDEAAVGGVPSVLVEGEVDAGVDTPVAEVAVGHSVHVVLLHQGLEVAKVGTQMGRRDGRVLPAGQGRAVEGPAGQSGALLADLPQHRLLGGRGDVPVGDRGSGCHHPVGRGGQLAGVVTGQLDVQVPPAAREVGHGSIPLGSAVDLDQTRAEALAGDRSERQHGGDVIGRLGHRRVAQHHEMARRGHRDQVDRGLRA